jgi:3-deoxy-manno-octulosonate cytidylyltransferase (CMP-KDO synthetase)
VSGFSQILGVIPARLGSMRLPAKVLAPINGKPMVWWVWKRTSRILPHVVVATDHFRVKRVLEPLGVSIAMTSISCRSGTDRAAEVARKKRFSFYLNIQGDEPLISPEAIQAVVRLMLKKRRGIFTAVSPAAPGDSRNPNVVKAVVNGEGRALYFSRSPVPFSWARGGRYLRHMGIYGYDRATLLALTKLPPTVLEARERLEQLRALENGIPIWMAHVGKASPAVDTAADLKRVRKQFLKGVH